jgi:hypothetical protein
MTGRRRGTPPMPDVDRSGRPLVRILEAADGTLICPRRGRIRVEACEACPYLCTDEQVAGSLVCSYPIPAAETYLARRRRRQDVRIALQHLHDQS